MVNIETIRGTPEGKVIRTMKIAPDEDMESLIKTMKEKFKKKEREVEYKKLKPKIKKAEVVGERVGGRVRQITKKVLAGAKRQAMIYQKQQAAQMVAQQAIEANRLAEQQRARYEQEDSFVPQEQLQEPLEDEYGRTAQQAGERGPGVIRKFGGGFGEAFRKWKEGQRMRQERMPEQSRMINPSQNMLNPQRSPLVREPSNLLRPIGGQLVREPANLLKPINGREIPWRIKTW